MKQRAAKARSRRGGGPGDVIARLSFRPGFTLVELLVALGLVSLLMLMFANVFEIATGTMTTQRGIMENDQRARTLTTVIGNDLKNLSMKSVMPFTPGETDYAVSDYFSFSNRQGFVSISENEPGNDLDDVLHFTASLRDPGAEPFYGRALPLKNLAADLNQPDADDGFAPAIRPWTASTPQSVGDYVAPTSTILPILDKVMFRCITAGTTGGTEPVWPTSLGATVTDGSVTWIATTYSNQTATSRMAEIVYFVRNGNLYRRVLLLRKPLDDAFDVQPFDAGANDFFNYTSPAPRYPAGGDFWREFDFSARFSADGTGAKFTDFSTVGVFPIASPIIRFGHNPITLSGHEDPGDPVKGIPPSIGNPREFVGNLFIGRFTQEETSHVDFNYPHSPSAYGALGVPTDPVDTPSTVLHDVNNNGVIDEYEGGPRRGEDILLSHVHGFDVKVWDDIVFDYVDVGHSLTNGAGVWGDFHQYRNLRKSYGPVRTNLPTVAPNNRMFDTWHPQFDADNNGAITPNDTPPFVPEYGSNDTWQGGFPYKIGSVVIPTAPNGRAYRAVSITSGASQVFSGTSGSTEPSWDPVVGNTTFDSNGAGTTITWQTIPNVKRLRSLKITIRYLDVSSDQMRQVTLIKSLMD